MAGLASRGGAGLLQRSLIAWLSGSGGRPGALLMLISYGAAFLFAGLALTAVLIAIHADPVEAYFSMFQSSLGSVPALSQTLNKTSPLLLGALGVAIAMRAGYVNLGIDGQIYAGAIAATGVAFALPSAPMAIVLPAVMIASLIGGAVLALLPAYLRAKRGVSELFVTVMMNFVAIYAAEYLAVGPWNDTSSGEALTRPIPDAAMIPRMLTGGGHFGIVLAVVLAVLVGLWLYRTRPGFELRAAGINPVAARFGGISTISIGLGALLVSGMLGGLAGGIEVAGVHGRLIMGMTPNYGYMAVLIAVLARTNPFAVVPMAIAFAILLVGGDSLQSSVGLPASVVLMFEGLVVLVVLLMETWLGRRRFVAA